LSNWNARRISQVLLRLFKNRLFMTFYVLIYLSAGLAIAYLWQVRIIFKILAIIILMVFAPNMQDLKDAWRGNNRVR
jgi:hypothetical protein